MNQTKLVIFWVITTLFLAVLLWGFHGTNFKGTTFPYIEWPQWWLHFTGSDNGRNYPWWSGAGSDLGEATLITSSLTVAYSVYRKANCHQGGCWRVGVYHVPGADGSHFYACRRHHGKIDNKAPFDFATHPLTRHHYDR